MFSLLFWGNNFVKMINLFAIFASEDGKQLFSHLCVSSNFPMLYEKMSQGCGSRQIMQIRTTAFCLMPCCKFLTAIVELTSSDVEKELNIPS